LLLISSFSCASAQDVIANPGLPQYIPDPAVPLIALPTEFTSHCTPSNPGQCAVMERWG